MSINMESDKLSESAATLLEKRCLYAKDCENEGIKACYEDFGECTIYQRKEIVNQRIGVIDIKPVSRIEKIVK